MPHGHHRRGGNGRGGLGLAADHVAVRALAHTVHRRDLVVVGHTVPDAGIGVAGGGGGVDPGVGTGGALRAIDVVGGRAGDGVPLQHGLAAGGGVADPHHGGGGLLRRHLGLAADHVAGVALADVIDGGDLVVIGHALLGAGVDVAGGGGAVDLGVGAVLALSAVDVVGLRTGHGIPRQHGLAAGGGVAEDHLGHRLGRHLDGEGAVLHSAVLHGLHGAVGNGVHMCLGDGEGALRTGGGIVLQLEHQAVQVALDAEALAGGIQQGHGIVALAVLVGLERRQLHAVHTGGTGLCVQFKQCGIEVHPVIQAYDAGTNTVQ